MLTEKLQIALAFLLIFISFTLLFIGGILEPSIPGIMVYFIYLIILLLGVSLFFINRVSSEGLKKREIKPEYQFWIFAIGIMASYTTLILLLQFIKEGLSIEVLFGISIIWIFIILVTYPILKQYRKNNRSKN
jgi:hypothetical protein